MIELNTIDAAAKAARQARETLAERATSLKDEIDTMTKRRLPGIKSAVAAVAEADSKLMGLLQQAPELFVRPKSMVLHGLQLGYKRAAGRIEIEDAKAVVKAIRKHFPERFEVLVKVKETPIKTAIGQLTGDELKKIGVTAQGSSEVTFIQDATDNVDKLVKALLKGTEQADDEEQDE